MDKFQVGDKIRVVNDHDTWLDRGQANDSIFTAVDDNGNDENVFCEKTFQVDIETLNDWPDDFELVSRPVSFSLDYIPTGGAMSFRSGNIGEAASETIMPITRNTTGVSSLGFPPSGMITLEQTVRVDPNDLALPEGIESDLFNKYREAMKNAHEGRLGMYRPNLEDRKVGKVRVELVDDGFPLALREIAKVMTWAQSAKGYKDHDWQNLPNPEQGLAGATSRHRTDHVIQRQVGKSAAIECTDHESNILHKAHEAFGVLAQLELILRGVIK